MRNDDGALATAVAPRRRTTEDLLALTWEAALHRAKEAARDKDVRIGGGVATVRQYVRAGLIDELHLVVRPILMGSGDELRLLFNASGLPALPPGWTREYLLKVDGWAKDRDANTAYSQSIEPLPFHGMSQYPYGPGESYPKDTIHNEYRALYNQRPALRLIRPLAKAN